MEAKYINPFINGATNALETMAGLELERKTPYLKQENQTQGDISGIIGFAGENVHGAVAMSFPQPLALKIYKQMMGESVFRITQDVEDCIGELANIVAGGAKTEFAEMGLSFHISIPTVVVGQGHTLVQKIDSPVMVIPFGVGKSRFLMEVTMKLGQNV
jgi:chemotaxis protein CheX